MITSCQDIKRCLSPSWFHFMSQRLKEHSNIFLIKYIYQISVYHSEKYLDWISAGIMNCPDTDVEKCSFNFWHKVAWQSWRVAVLCIKYVFNMDLLELCGVARNISYSLSSKKNVWISLSVSTYSIRTHYAEVQQSEICQVLKCTHTLQSPNSATPMLDFTDLYTNYKYSIYAPSVPLDDTKFYTLDL